MKYIRHNSPSTIWLADGERMRTGGREMSEARLGRERRDLILRRGEN